MVFKEDAVKMYTYMSKIIQKEKNQYCILMYIYMVSRKMVLINLFAGQTDADVKNGLMETVETGWDKLRK